MQKRFTLLAIVLVLFSSMFIISCSDDDDSVEVTINSTQDLVNYLDNKGMGIDDMLTNWIKTAAAVNDVMTDADASNDYYIMDIRSAALFEKGHIPGAVNSSLATIITDASACGGKTIAVVCYTGQSACHAVVALRLSGYSDAFSIMWGMSGWHTDINPNGEPDPATLTDANELRFDYWSAGTAQLNHANWVAAPGNATVPVTTYALPAVTLEGNTDAEIVANRAYWITQNFHKKTATDVLDNNTNYFINNYWAATDVTTYGNIDGAYRINPIDLSLLNPDLPIVTYCWTGQTSSMITAYLGALGYDAWSLGNGANAMIYDDLTGHKWDATAIVDLPLEGTLAK